MLNDPAKRIPFLIALFVITLICFVQWVSYHSDKFDLFKRLEALTYDWRIRRAAELSPNVNTNLALVVIDNESIDKLNSGFLNNRIRWPWPRFIYGRIVRELSAQGANVIGFDIFYPELDPVTRENLLETPDGRIVSSDVFFTEEIAKSRNVVLGTEGTTVSDFLFTTNAIASGNIYAELDSGGILRRAKAFIDVTRERWHPELEYLGRALGLDLDRPIWGSNGSLSFPFTDAQDPYEVPLTTNGYLDVEELGGETTTEPQSVKLAYRERIWHLGIVLAAHYLNLDLAHALVKNGQVLLNNEQGVLRTIPIDEEGFFYINWAFRWEDLRRHHATSVLDTLSQDELRQQGEIPRPQFKDKIVVIGSVATGNNVSDLGATPLEPQGAMLVTKHVNVAHSLLTGQFIHPFNYSTHLGLILFFGSLSAFLSWKLRALNASFWVVSSILIYVLVTVYAFVQYHYWLPIILPVLGSLLMTHICMVTYRVIFEQKEQRRVKGIFSKVVSPNVVQELLDADILEFGGTRKKLTVFFADVRGFTEMTDHFQEEAESIIRVKQLQGKDADGIRDAQARETLETVNHYLATIANMVKKHNGTLDKYMGDCVMAFWGAPTPNEQHAADSVRTAIDAQRAMQQSNLEKRLENEKRRQENLLRCEQGLAPLQMHPLLSLGTGINTGIVTVGLMGSVEHIFNYTVFGREVNLASRLEGVSGWGRIIIGEGTYEELQRQDPTLAEKCVKRDSVQVKGIHEPVPIYEVLWKDEETTIEPLHPNSDKSSVQ